MEEGVEVEEAEAMPDTALPPEEKVEEEGGGVTGGKNDVEFCREASGVVSPRLARSAHCRSNASHSCRDETERVMSSASA